MPVTVAPRKLLVFQYTRAVGIAANRKTLCQGSSQRPPGRSTSVTTSADITDAGTNDSHRSTGSGRRRRESIAIGPHLKAMLTIAIATRRLHISAGVTVTGTSPPPRSPPPWLRRSQALSLIHI